MTRRTLVPWLAQSWAIVGLLSLTSSLVLGQQPPLRSTLPREPQPGFSRPNDQESARSALPTTNNIPSGTVLEVRVTGNQTVELSKVYARLKTRAGRAFDPEVVQADVRALTEAGWFKGVRTYTLNQPGGIVVTFEVVERPTIRYVKYVGNRSIQDKQLSKQAGIKVGDALNLYAVEEARRKVEEFYQSKGFSNTIVSIFEGDKAGDQGVVLLIAEGKVERIASVGFVGNTIASDARLKTQIQSKPGFLWYFFKGKVDRKKIDEDVDRLTAYYRSLGFFRARVGRELDYDESGKWLRLRFVIDEGPRYVIRNIAVNGNEKLSSAVLIDQLDLKSGDYFNLAMMNKDVNMLRDLYGSQGHIFADIKADPRFLEDPIGQLDLVYNIEEGDLFRVGSINIQIDGDYPHTRRDVIMNRLSFYPGQTVDIRTVRESERRLKASQLFIVNPAEGEPPRIVIRPPELDDSVGTLAGGKKRRAPGGQYRGQSPDPVSASAGGSQQSATGTLRPY